MTYIFQNKSVVDATEASRRASAFHHALPFNNNRH
jgi:hypothetical protein